MSMKHSIIMNPQQIAEQGSIEDVQQSLELIELKLDSEILAKQKTIEHQQQEIQRLHVLIESKDRVILETSEKLKECTTNNEGNRQLINKLLGDIDRLHQDIDWYRRTYEKRSFLGTIREKLIKKN
jgi:peptidoglycan hydrolase CwlO-like protein